MDIKLLIINSLKTQKFEKRKKEKEKSCDAAEIIDNGSRRYRKIIGILPAFYRTALKTGVKNN